MLRPFYAEAKEDSEFYTALRRLYFANVAAYLCQYHDETPLTDEELKSIDSFVALKGQAKPFTTSLVNLQAFLTAWESLKYNLVTNAGERYEAVSAYVYIETLAERFTRAVIEGLLEQQQ
ncbi:hypothetical protein [Dictyobacter formicarum]|uniref:Uncharacterized protein n=1 Tax=Dictyobacter formicarum TaxID=2778368 RepID=A0ABQ3VHQ3_9CHLR|nr:hypothetical protein [Dictyobacter formicarum]GHO85206.1 hypothetical protein KSZ_32120 [Dictyobacter formicarum]